MSGEGGRVGEGLSSSSAMISRTSALSSSEASKPRLGMVSSRSNSSSFSSSSDDSSSSSFATGGRAQAATLFRVRRGPARHSRRDDRQSGPDSTRPTVAPKGSRRGTDGAAHEGLQGVIRYHPAAAERRQGEKRKNIPLLEINDCNDSVTSCLCGKKGERTEKRSCVEKKRLIRPPTPPDTLKSLINSRPRT